MVGRKSPQDQQDNQPQQCLPACLILHRDKFSGDSTEDELLGEVTQLFQLMDKDGSGELKKSEFITAFKMDQDVVKFCKSHARLAPLLDPITFKEAFIKMDADESGTISLNELIEHWRTTLSKTNEFSDADINLPNSANVDVQIARDSYATDKRKSLQTETAANLDTNTPGALNLQNSKLDEEIYDVANFYWTEGYAQVVARSDVFINTTLAVISLNAVYLGIDADHNKAELLLEADWGFIMCEYLFCIFFVSELVIRFLAFESKLNCLRDGWFKFDSFLVILMVMETCVLPFVMPLLSSGSKPPPTGPLRLLRLLRLSRLVRLMRSLPELVIIIKGMVVAFRAVGSSLLMVTMLLYVFGIVMHMMLSEDDDENVAEYFQTLPCCMWTLLMDGTFLLDTHTVLGFLVHTGEFNHILCVAIFLVFILLTALTVMNMLIGVLCEVVSAVAANEKEEAAIRVMKQTILIELKKFDDGDGLIDEDELNELMADPYSVTVLESLGIDVPFLQELQVMTFDKPGMTCPIEHLIEQMLTCRRDLIFTVKHMVLQQKLSHWNLENKIMKHEQRMEKKIQSMVQSIC